MYYFEECLLMHASCSLMIMFLVLHITFMVDLDLHISICITNRALNSSYVCVGNRHSRDLLREVSSAEMKSLKNTLGHGEWTPAHQSNVSNTQIVMFLIQNMLDGESFVV